MSISKLMWKDIGMLLRTYENVDVCITDDKKTFIHGYNGNEILVGAVVIKTFHRSDILDIPDSELCWERRDDKVYRTKDHFMWDEKQDALTEDDQWTDRINAWLVIGSEGGII